LKLFLRRAILLGVISSLLLISIIPAGIVKAEVKTNTIYTCYQATPPVIDGHHESWEWTPAVPESIRLYNIVNQADTINITVMTLYTEEDNLIFGVKILDTDNGEADDQLAIVLQTNTADPLVRKYDEGWGYGKDQDIKYIYSHNNYSVDGLTKDYVGFTWVDDISLAGTEDSVGKVHPEIGVDYYELEFPLDSGDTAGMDPALAINSDIAIFFLYKDDSSVAVKTYSQIREADGDFDYAVLTIACTSAASIQLFPIIVGIITISFAGILYSKKKKK